MALRAMLRSLGRLSVVALNVANLGSEDTRATDSSWKTSFVWGLLLKRIHSLHAVQYLNNVKLAVSGKHIWFYENGKFSDNVICECNTRSLTPTTDGGLAYSCLTDKCIKTVNFTGEDKVDKLKHLGRYNDISAVAYSPTGRWAMVDRYPDDPFVIIRDGEGKLIRTISLPENGKNYHLAWGQKDRLYVSDAANHTVTAYSPDGVEVWTVGTGSASSGAGQLNCPGGVAETPHGSLLVCDTGNQRVAECYTDGHCRDVISEMDKKKWKIHFPHIYFDLGTDVAPGPRDLSLNDENKLAIATDKGLLICETRIEEDAHVSDAILEFAGMVTDTGFNYHAEVDAAASLYGKDPSGNHHVKRCKKHVSQPSRGVHTDASAGGVTAGSGSGGGGGGGQPPGKQPGKQDECHVLAQLAIRMLIDVMITLFIMGEYKKLRGMITTMRQIFSRNEKITKSLDNISDMIENKDYCQKRAGTLFRRLGTQLNKHHAFLFFGDASANRSSGSVIRWAKTFIYTDSEVCPCLQEEFLWRCLDIPRGFTAEQAVDVIVLFLCAFFETDLVPGNYYGIRLACHLRNVSFIDMSPEEQFEIAWKIYKKYKKCFSSSNVKRKDD